MHCGIVRRLDACLGRRGVVTYHRMLNESMPCFVLVWPWARALVVAHARKQHTRGFDKNMSRFFLVGLLA